MADAGAVLAMERGSSPVMQNGSTTARTLPEGVSTRRMPMQGAAVPMGPAQVIESVKVRVWPTGTEWALNAFMVPSSQIWNSMSSTSFSCVLLTAARRGDDPGHSQRWCRCVCGRGAGRNTGYTLQTADRPYRLLVEEMQQGVLTLSGDGTIAYSNRHFADLVGRPLEQLMGVAFRIIPLDAQIALRQPAATRPRRFQPG